MKTLKLLFLSFLMILLSSCSDDAEPLLDVVSNNVANFHAPHAGGMGQPITGEFTKFSFSTGTKLVVIFSFLMRVSSSKNKFPRKPF